MFEDSVSSSIPSIWASMNSWLTPAVLFVLLNLMIGTIAFTSTFSSNPKRQENPQQPPTLDRSPSVLQRLRSINLPYYRSQPPNPDLNPHSDSDQTRQSQNPERETQFVLPQTHFENKMLDLEEEAAEEKGGELARSLDEVYSQLSDNHLSRAQSDTKPASGEMPEKLPARMKKSASLKSAFGHFEEDHVVVQARRPATVKEGKSSAADSDDEVDAKADVFINRFKRQLQLQRLDSIVRYKEMIGRGGAK